MAIDPRDPDASLVVLFKNLAVPNEGKSAAAGRLVCDDVEVCEVRAPGNRTNVAVFPATSVSDWQIDPHTGGQVQRTYAERFSKQYRQFKQQVAQTMSGTPLSHAPFLTEGRRAELRAQNVYTVEQLAGIDGAELKNLGPGGREMKNQSIEFLAAAKANAPNTMMVAELEQLRASNQLLQEDLQRARGAADKAAAEFEDMNDDQLRDYIKAHTGHAPQGTPPRKTLVRMAIDARPSKAA